MNRIYLAMCRLLKTFGYALASSVLRVWHVRLGPSAIILMYHSFDDIGWKYGVSPRMLERQLAYLASKTRVVPLADVVAFATATPHTPPPSPSPTVVITVDDVYEDTYTVLFPLLKRYRMPATLFLTTDLSPREKLGNLPRPTWEQLKEMQDSGLVTVEVHGRTHVNWPTLETDQALASEIIGAREDIETHLGYHPRFAAYPAGRRDARIAAYLKEIGFEAAVAITEGAVYAGDDPYALKRVQVDRTMTHTLFRLRLDPSTHRIIRIVKRLFRT